MNININVSEKRASVIGAPIIVCGNSDYSITFDFDAEWAGTAAKTARFAYAQGGVLKHQDVVFFGNVVDVPVLSNVREVYVGVYAGNLRTTTPARICCKRSILCGDPVHDEPPADVYNQIMTMVSNMQSQIDELRSLIECGGGSSGGESSGNENAEAYEVTFYEESDYSDWLSHDETFDGVKVDEKIPTVEQMEDCAMVCYFDGETSLNLSDAEVVDAYGDGSRYLIYFRFAGESELNHSKPHFIVNKDPSYASGVGLFAVYETFEDSCSQVYEGTASMYSATITFPEV